MEILKRKDLFNFITLDDHWINFQFYFISDEKIDLYVNYYDNCKSNLEMKNIEYPYEEVLQIPFILKELNEKYLIIELYLDHGYRFHFVKRIIPISWIKCVINHNTIDNRPHIILEQNKFEELVLTTHSLYISIDFIGTKKAIFDKGTISENQFNKLFEIIDEYAKENPEVVFLTLADNILIKYDWNYRDQRNFKPEKVVLLAKVIMDDLLSILNINSYAIASQGVNYLNIDIRNRMTEYKNHLIFPSISSPFIEITTIENDVREKIKSKIIESKNLYIEKSLFYSLNKIFEYQKQIQHIKFEKVKSKTLENNLEYLPIEYSKMTEILNCP